MSPERDPHFEQRVTRAAEAALADHQYVSIVDLLTGMNLLAPSNVEAWKRGRLDFLEQMIQGSPQKLGRAFTLFRTWAEARGLKPTETPYLRSSRDGTVPLRFTLEGDPAIEAFFRTHYVSPNLPKRKQEKLAAPEPPVVFQILKDSACSECASEIERDDFLLMEAGQPLCLPCARLGDLEFLPAGDAALTRRATKYSARTAVVVRFSKSRGRYERQGILVEKPAIEKAEAECSADAEDRARARASGEKRRQQDDRELVARMTEEILGLFPGCPPREAAEIAARTAARGSGRVGRTAAGRKLAREALTLAVAAAVRHRHTNYDELLASGMDRERARSKVSERVQQVMAAWS